ncbi:MAG TPA: SET domain-containing protein-lysine N-methyltransferase [Leptospiraceae bacterium]|nr:SET domain-containing protein-lysine N-methyltransferase [Leptospiraceae bacterium]HMW08456.1 SET domain-containing protein-lysine N-methyltransferase [Leptospiraceae bacterium]HMX33890.1 SET domain-containing protein-lysine N-methyltransferase [Leptospiraceae bacterium]HMY34203.1 SET domain-containing protein-lysine N-methyltransferase [Leptospiraceae bacterium]HMZ66421.1 SET domain-containing protein-lysine N-methyltransferase [Leptospiraceae bacterium]
MKLFLSILLIINSCAVTSVKSIEDNEYVVIKPSHIPGAGMGLFAAKDIPKDTMVTHYEGKKVTRKEYNAIHEKSEHWYMFTMPECANEPNYPYLDGNRDHYGSKVNFAPSKINGKPTKLQNVHFLKHCEEPYIRLYASRDIKKGEELYVSYGGIYNYHFMEFPDVQKFFLEKSGIKLKPNEKFTFED